MEIGDEQLFQDVNVDQKAFLSINSTDIVSSGGKCSSQKADRPPFPFEQLTGQPLVYASLGTIQNRLLWAFEAIAQACADLDVQLVISLGGAAEPETLGPLAGQPLVVKYAPQLELLAQAAKVIVWLIIDCMFTSIIFFFLKKRSQKIFLCSCS